MMLLVLVSLTYWADTGDRVDSTVTILLAVSALYIVIFDNIPMLGYLTRFDNYILHMFLMLIIAVFSHQIVCVFDKECEEDIRPLKGFAARCIETTGRLMIFPYVLITFETSLLEGNLDDMGDLPDLLWAMVGCFFILMYPWEILLLYKQWDRTIEDIGDKIEDPSNPKYRNSKLTPHELYFFNLWTYRHFWNFTADHHRKVLEKDRNDDMLHHEENMKTITSSAVGRVNPLHVAANTVLAANAFKQAGAARGDLSTNEKKSIGVEMTMDANKVEINSNYDRAYSNDNNGFNEYLVQTDTTSHLKHHQQQHYERKIDVEAMPNSDDEED